MCRLLAHVSARPATFAQVIGDAQCELFYLMAGLHDDGWGAMWVQERSDGSSVVDRVRVPESGRVDNQLSDVLQGHAHRAMVAHLRLATRSMGLDVRNTHPFVTNGNGRAMGSRIGMAHNGAIVPTGHLRDLIRPEIMADVVGQTDSELYFALIRQEIAKGLPVDQAAARAVAQIRIHYPRPSLNAMLLTADELVVVHASSSAPVPYEDFSASKLADSLPLHHDEAYFQMSYRRFLDGSLAFTSAGLDTWDWQPIPEDTVIRVDLATMSMTSQSVLAVHV